MPGGDCKDYSKYHDRADSNGDIISSWAENVSAGHFRCTICNSSALTFNRGMVSFNQHAGGKVHRENIKKTDKYRKQLSISQSFKAVNEETEVERELNKKIQNLEIDIVRRCSSHNVPLRFVSCLTDLLETHLSNDNAKDIVQGLKLKETKARYVAQHGIAKTYLEETIQKLQTCDAFSIGFDESEMNKVHEMEILVMIANKKEGIELRHYRTVALDGTDAETISNTIIEQLQDDNINWKQKLISLMTDGCPTMQGCASGVKKRIIDQAPQIIDFGSCNGHHIGNAARHACSEIHVTNDYDKLCEVFIDVIYDIGGAPGKGLKKKEAFERLAKEKGREVVPFASYGGTRFRGYTNCIIPILHNWESIIDYYSNVGNPTDRQKKLIDFFVTKEFESLLKLNFIMAATKDVMEAIDYFEVRENKIHLARAKMETVLRTQLMKFMKKSVVDKIDDDGKVCKRTGNELLLINLDEDSNFLSKNSVFIGQKCSQIIRDLGLEPSYPQLDWFFKMVFDFYTTLVTKMIGYFSIGLRSIELEYMDAFSPNNRRSADTFDKILFLGGSFTKVLNNIRPHDGFDKLRKEVELYQVDEEVRKIDPNLSYNNYWMKVEEITEGSEKWVVYEVLPRFARALGTPFNSGSEMERGFSKQSDILRDPKRNGLKHETLDTCLQIRFGMESKETVSKCSHSNCSNCCKCHCNLAEISDKMRENCSNAYRTLKSVEQSKKNDTIDVQQESENEGLKKRLNKFKESLSKRSTFYQAQPRNKKQVLTDKNAAMEERKRQAEVNNNFNKPGPSKKKKIPIRKHRDIDSDVIVDNI